MSGRILRITILVELPKSIRPEQVQIETQAAQVQADAGGNGESPELALSLLTQMGVKAAESLLDQYDAGRICQVCNWAAAQKGRLTNPPGWIRTALRRGWTPIPTPGRPAG